MMDNLNDIPKTISGCWEWDLVNDRLYWPKTLYALFDSTPHQESGLACIEGLLACMEKGEELALRSAIDACIHNGLPIRRDFRIRNASGRQAPIRLLGDPISIDGRIGRIVGCVIELPNPQDVPDKCTTVPDVDPLAAAQGISTSKNRDRLFQFISEYAGDVLWTYDFNINRYTYASPSVYRLRGFTPEEVLRQSLYDALTPESAKKAIAVVAARTTALESGDMSAMFQVNEFDQLRKDGSAVRTEVMTTLVRNNSGQVVGIVGIARDITERLEQERKRQAFEKHIHESQKLETMDRIAGGIAHELNNQLTPIMGYAGLIGEMKLTQENIQEYADHIFQSATRARDLVGHLLDFSRGRSLSFELTDLNSSINNIRQLLRSITRENIRLSIHTCEPLPLANINIDKIRQVIVNLIINAQDAMPDGGTLIIRTGVAEIEESRDGQMLIPAGRYVQFSVSDTGTGIAPEVMPHIFEPFFTSKKFGTASGLGLASVYGIVKQHKGHIHVDSDLGKGTCFTISLPAAG